jgi:hypothetical protein
MIEKLKILRWAGVHHDEFNCCLIVLFISIQVRRHYPSGAVRYLMDIHLRRVVLVVIPWAIQFDCFNTNNAHGMDDIRF